IFLSLFLLLFENSLCMILHVFPFFLFLWISHLLYFYFFPTRRSSDLDHSFGSLLGKNKNCLFYIVLIPFLIHCLDRQKPSRNVRSEEHTSELQSRFDIVCRLLL